MIGLLDDMDILYGQILYNQVHISKCVLFQNFNGVVTTDVMRGETYLFSTLIIVKIGGCLVQCTIHRHLRNSITQSFLFLFLLYFD